MNYRITLKPSARRELERLPDPLLARVDRVILSLEENPRPQGTVKLTGLPLYRVRVGSHRILYEVDDRTRTVCVVAVGHRKDVYRR